MLTRFRTLSKAVLGMTWLASLSPARAEDIRIAVVGPMTGSNASVGDQVKRGAELAAKDINAAGGVLGRKIVLDVEDDVCDPKQAVSVANRVIGEEIKLVDGHMCSGAAIPASAVYADSGVLMMSPAAVNARLTDEAFAKKWPTIMRFYARDDAQGELVGAWLAKTYPNKKIAFLNDKSAYGRALADGVRASMNAHGVKEMLNESLNPGEKDYSALVSKLKAADVDVVYFGGFGTEAGLIVRQAADQGFKFQLVGTSGLIAPEFWSIAGPAGEGTKFPFPVDPSQFSDAKRVVEEFKETGYAPEGFTLFSYATIQTLAEGVKRVGKVDPVAIAKALRSGEPVNTVFGPMTFDAKGDAQGIGYDILEWRDGRHVKAP
jgi:branched-chain amino acid transport system substrate-binding protein